jgi:glucose-6-phosphate 1-dehydrogenase
MSYRSDAIVLFGASGDLAKKMLFPALAQLSRDGLLPARVIGVAASDWDDEQLREYARRSITEYGDGDASTAAVTRLLDTVSYVRGDYREPATFAKLVVVDAEHGLLREGGEHGPVQLLGAGQVAPEGFLEHDAATLVQADTDHARNDRAEHAGRDGEVEQRAFGVLEPFRIVQNHLLQVLALVAMEPPIAADAGALRDEKVKVLRAVRPLAPGDVVRGQFSGYRDEEGVAEDSDAETFIALKLSIDSWRWSGVPFYIRTGKHLPVTATEVLIEFKRPPQLFFADAADPPHPNHLLFRLKPGEEVSLGMQINDGGEQLRSRGIDLTYEYSAERDGHRQPAYARLFQEAKDGQQRLFARADGVEAAWRIVDPVLADHPSADVYDQGTWGPTAAEELIAGDGVWHDPAGSGV